MKLHLRRLWKRGDATIGQLTVNSRPECLILEDVVRERDVDGDGAVDAADVAEFKVYGETAIPSGRYRVTMHNSPKFGRVPKLHDVPGYTDILIHAGNRAAHTKGCLITGRVAKGATVEQSRVALEALISKIEQAEHAGEEIWITIENAFEEET